MLRDRKIAVFVDVDNALLEYQHYDNVIQQLRSMGEIVCGTVYGASERKHKKVICDAKNNGFAIQLPSRTRRRVRKVFDDRIFVDVTDLISHNSNIDTVAIVSHPADLVYLFSYLRRAGIQVVSTDDLDEQSLALVSQTLDLGKVEQIKLPRKTAVAKKTVAPKAAPKAEPKAVEQKAAKPKVEEPKAEEPKRAAKAESAENDRTAELLREIEMLKKSYETPAKEKPVKQQQPVVEEPIVEDIPEPVEEPQPDIKDETQSLMEKIASLQEEPAAVQQPTIAERPREEAPERVAEPVFEEEPPMEEGPRASYVSQNDSDLIRRIEELRRSNAGNDSDDLIAEIKKLLDGLE